MCRLVEILESYNPLIYTAGAGEKGIIFLGGKET